MANVELLASPEKIRWQQSAARLRIELPRQKSALDYAVAFKISLARSAPQNSAIRNAGWSAPVTMAGLLTET